MSDQHIAAVARVRAFNRFYTRQIGVLEEHLLHSDLTLTEVRVLFELAEGQGISAAQLGQRLGLNAGYLSRLLSGLQTRGLLRREPSAMDGRANRLVLTDAGRAVFAQLDAASNDSIGAMVQALSEPGQQRLVESMAQIQTLLGDTAAQYVLRDPRPGDMGWVIHKHGTLYAREFGWNAEFEALVADIVTRYLREHDPQTERCWIAELDGTPVGSVFVVRHDAQNAKLRLLHVDASARGLGIGQRLVEEAMTFARAVGYKRMVLWTNAALTDARRLYERAGFELLTEQHEQLFGMPQVSQLWARAL
ncbi:bifunctional helix-turn-helix transcriptional regulator/GNAT family N-acetyltransferase [Stenotrophomonas oahuensis]|uniref:Bifunctional helix-turn-helix transcriptional regulator/GNAT family N-acetyltransferase n=1 Tax=Stenotrophomonas oahuensis TaxID=3003271 RepID=A0ABY9YSD8_9GAMM|nr:bifunctional helix-turn-helix transcriptional regulator/GNAT family N-acetyltransferase [Stenotrophomonas sp. A5586]WNH53628.1 bifunctional helix-turn-helix transcriptional regulator/GNAT family N-acetyltransferase [Stenotrophomonas sp. A5586]